ncbi:hypothetical protein [Pseudoalteromonas mariniglutinosa]|uniref:hypothetical protein n=1 Tax=Pseudoalteromonas mariniglutinosa TaxID=206042 RepID=UPI00384DE108
MSERSHFTSAQRIIKHLLVWLILAYCFNSAINLLTLMAQDAHPDHALLAAAIFCCAFNVLTAHLISKYERHWPFIAAVIIACVGTLAIPFFTAAQSTVENLFLTAMVIISLPIATFIIVKIKQRNRRNSTQSQ